MIIFLYGEDSFRSHQKLLEIKQKYLSSDKSGSGLSSFDFEEKAKVADTLAVFGIPNLLAPKRLVVVKNIISGASSEDQKMMERYLKENKKKSEDRNLVIVFWESGNPKKSGVLFKTILASAEGGKQNFEKLDGAKLNQWTLRGIKKIDAKAGISRQALEKLIAYCGSETGALDKEISKLVNYTDGKMINERDVETLVKAKIDGNVFSAIDAMGANNKKEAMKLLHDNIQKGEDSFYLFSMFVYQFRNMLKISDLKERGTGSEYEISRITKMHPFVIRKTMAQTRYFTFARLKKMYNKLADLDVKVKTGKIDMKMALDKFVAEL